MTFFKKKKIIFNLIFLFLLGIILFIIKNKDTIKAVNDKNSNAISNNSSMSSILEMLTPPENNYDHFLGFEEGVFGQKKLKQKLNSYINIFKPDKLKDFQNLLQKNDNKKNPKIPYPKGILLYGPPGTGKTFISQAFAKESKMNLYNITSAHSLKEIEEIFKKARRNSPSIVFADEAEELIKSRTSQNLETGDAKKTNTFLMELDGVNTDPENPIFFIAATNHLDKIDSAIQNRLDPIYLGYFNDEERAAYFIQESGKYKFAKNAEDYLKEKIIPRFEEAIKNPIKYAKMIGKKEHNLANGKEFKFEIPAISKTQKEMKGSLMTSDDVLTDQSNRENIEKSYKEQYKTDQIEKDLDISYLDKVKKHFFDIQTTRKIKNFLFQAFLFAGNHSHQQILISDLEEASKEYFGPNLDYMNENLNQ
ncbi:MAG: ATP-binding protein [Candidatus Phytoplasma pruni]|uniref:ATP-binding protein n=2 Tax=16SrIII (X-disease group) TaxID=85623 RepID=UPI000361C660|nr:ATP-binding protein [Vaccinium witches'-broom phytoplasma]